jgi:BirA family biotin operon repressor/biotin-[acetyl-CoA-carboxylase] ligase
VPLDSTRLQERLDARWSRIEVVDSTASTNADLLADSTAPDRSVLVAEDQVAGRGRFERSWRSPPRAGLTFSVLLRPPVPMPSWGWLPLLAGVALHDAVRTATGVPTSLKWPNDLLATDGRKLAGILAQSAADAVVVGIGLNVSTTAAELPVPTASSLALAGATDLDRTTLLIRLLAEFDASYERWTRDGSDGLRTAYLAASSTVGARVEVTFPTHVLLGEAVDVDGHGRLVVRADGGGDVTVSAGDVRHVRPAPPSS